MSRQRLRCRWRFRRAVAAHRRHVLVQAIQQLPPECRDVFVLHRYEDMPLEEIAAHLRIDHALAETRLVEALNRLCRALDEAEARPSSERK